MTTTNNAPANPFPPMEPPTMESEVKASSDHVERLEGAEGGSRWLWEDAIAFAAAIGLDRASKEESIIPEILAALNGSIDAALSLAGRVLPGWHWDVRHWALRQPSAVFTQPGSDRLKARGVFKGVAATPALAICAAILKARQPENTGGEG